MVLFRIAAFHTKVASDVNCWIKRLGCELRSGAWQSCLLSRRDEDLSRPSDTLYFVNTTASELDQAERHDLSTLGNLKFAANISATAQLSSFCLTFRRIPRYFQSVATIQAERVQSQSRLLQGKTSPCLRRT